MAKAATNPVVQEARRDAIRALDEYGCTVAELRAAFGVSESAFHVYAEGTRASPRPAKPQVARIRPGEEEDEIPEILPMTPADAIEIATVALLKRGYPVSAIVEALRKTSRSQVYRLREAWITACGGHPSAFCRKLSPAQYRMHRRHIPSWPDIDSSPPGRRRMAKRRRMRWVTRNRGHRYG
jgi:hypothetical protein